MVELEILTINIKKFMQNIDCDIQNQMYVLIIYSSNLLISLSLNPNI